MKNTRQSQKEKTRETLYQAAYKVFSRDGIAAARMADIAKEAGVSYGTVFVHFESQEALIEDVVAHFAGAIAMRTHELAQRGGRLSEMLSSHLQGISDYEPFYTRLVLENRLLPPGARDSFMAIQSAVSLHFSQALLAETGLAGMKETQPAVLYNLWIGLVHHYLVNGDLFAPEGGVIRRYGKLLTNSYMRLVVGGSGNV